MKNAIRSPKIRIALLLSLIGATAFFLFYHFTKPWVLDYPTELPPHSPRRLGSEAIAIRFSPDGKYLLVAGEITGGKSGHFGSDNGRSDFQRRDRRLRLFDVEKQKEIERLKAEPLFSGLGGNNMLLMSDFRTLLTTTGFYPVKVIDIRKRSPDRTIVQPDSTTVTSMSLSPNEKILALGTIYGVQFYDTHSLKFLKDYENPNGKGTEVTFGRTSNVVKVRYFGSLRAHFVNVRTGKRIPTPRSTREFEVTFSPDGKYFADKTGMNTFEVWQHNAKQSFKISTINTDFVEINIMQFSPNNKTLAVGGTSSSENSVRFYLLSAITALNKPL